MRPKLVELGFDWVNPSKPKANTSLLAELTPKPTKKISSEIFKWVGKGRKRILQIFRKKK